jgi:hypothetical protein
MYGRIVAALLSVGLLASTAAPALGQEPDLTLVKFTKYVPVAKGVVVPAGQTVRFRVDSHNFGRVSLLVAGDTQPGATSIDLQTLFGPPLVPGGDPRPLTVNADGKIAVSFVEPVRGPSMVIAIHNDSTAGVTLTIGAYLAY